MSDETCEPEADEYLRQLPRQPPEWAIVFDEIKNIDDAIALMGLFEHGDDTLYANDLPIDAFVRSWAFLGERSLSEWLAQLLRARDGGPWKYTDIYTVSRGTEPDSGVTDALVARCRARGVELAHRPSPPSPWRVVLAQVVSVADAGAMAMLAAHYVANNWPFELDEVRVPPTSARATRPGELADFIARCRKAGVYLLELERP
jgi:hypothetical protein